jgi:hypothetical protein
MNVLRPAYDAAALGWKSGNPRHSHARMFMLVQDVVHSEHFRVVPKKGAPCFQAGKALGRLHKEFSFPAESLLDAAIVPADADVLVDALLKNGLPGHKLEVETALDHGEASAGQIGNARQPAGHILARPGWCVGHPALGCHLQTDTLHFLPLKRSDGAARDDDGLPVIRGDPISTSRSARRWSASITSRSKPTSASGVRLSATSSRSSQVLPTDTHANTAPVVRPGR